MYEYVNIWILIMWMWDGINEYMNDNVWMNEWLNECMNEYMNEYMNM